MAHRFVLPIFLTACAAVAPLGAQVTATLPLTPGANGITASSVYMSFIPGDPAPGGDFTQWTGTITVQLDDAFHPTTLSILAANLVAQDAGTFGPALLGAPGGPAAPANYAFARYGLGAPGGFPASNALRDLQGTLGSAPLALSGAAGGYSFAPAGVGFSVTNGRVDYRAVVNNGAFGGALSLTGTGANNASAGGATLATDGSFMSLQLPLDLTIVTSLPAGPQSGAGFPITFRFVGTLNATGVIPEPSTWALAAIGLSGLALGLRGKGRRKKEER